MQGNEFRENINGWEKSVSIHQHSLDPLKVHEMKCGVCEQAARRKDARPKKCANIKKNIYK